MCKSVINTPRGVSFSLPKTERIMRFFFQRRTPENNYENCRSRRGRQPGDMKLLLNYWNRVTVSWRLTGRHSGWIRSAAQLAGVHAIDLQEPSSIGTILENADIVVTTVGIGRPKKS